MNALVRSIAVPAVLGLTACFPLGSGNVYLHADDPQDPYSGSVLSGDFCFVSGATGDPSGSFDAEVLSALDALELELGRAGLTLSQLVQITVYLSDIEDYQTFNEIYAARVPEPHPARTVVQVEALPGDARLEIQAIARRH